MKKLPKLYIVFYLLVISAWLIYVTQNQLFYYIEKHIWAVVTMIFGSFIAGSSPEGSAAVAYPVFTLLLDIKPAVARNFAFAIQSIGMTAASLLILGLRIKVDWNYIKYVTIGGIFGLVFGTYYVVPLISPPMAKLFFVSLWLSFGIVLWRENLIPTRMVHDLIENFQKSDMLKLLFFGLIGGIISSIFGTGINIFTFCLMTIYYGINEKVAVPSSIIIMSIETLLGFFMHAGVINDFQPEAFEMWIACIPFVIVFAPLGSFVVSKLPRTAIANFLNIILFVQFAGAMWVIKPNAFQLTICGLTLLSGLILFFFLSKNARS
ncbi:sulfite exporter TauE/SafE family protein [Lacihabitans soyangensis]|uniref:Probable membrane transporter protein n=1 Tax=Lacihabitans soyangensis TaxID=869394 RepID=A0AAE3KTX4_9BACT|nr:sulfite exporter TauE/SafE family protein [Lacihabitans soyangensis]MCP9764977.1 sulfite exporter TauE/SafE family protein [Lacihabitans soyangensis]